MEPINPYSGIFDSHAHYDDERFDADRGVVLEGLAEEGVAGLINVGCTLPTSRAAVALAERYDFVYAAVGFHPHHAAEWTEADEREMLPLLDHPKVLAIGEIGLDYHYDFSPKEEQKQVFERQVALAAQRDLPIIIHSREAAQDTLEILSRHPGVRGVVHCFSGSAETAKILLSMGYHIGFTGSLTFKNARRIVEACAAVPLDRLLLETDCPYMAPVPYRGSRCYSPMIARVAEKAAELHGVSPQDVIDAARENTRRLFGIR